MKALVASLVAVAAAGAGALVAAPHFVSDAAADASAHAGNMAHPIGYSRGGKQIRIGSVRFGTVPGRGDTWLANASGRVRLPAGRWCIVSHLLPGKRGAQTKRMRLNLSSKRTVSIPAFRRAPFPAAGDGWDFRVFVRVGGCKGRVFASGGSYFHSECSTREQMRWPHIHRDPDGTTRLVWRP